MEVEERKWEWEREQETEEKEKQLGHGWLFLEPAKPKILTIRVSDLAGL